jgi:beta-1,4-N-acetylglucosaminyltransferase
VAASQKVVSKSKISGEGNMNKIKVLSIIGSTYPLDRLTEQLDKLGKNKKYEIFAQIGESSYVPKNIKWKKFLAYEEMQNKIGWTDIIVSHAGAGCIIDALIAKKRLLLFPRLKKFGEAVDDHQLEICEALNLEYKIPVILNNNDLLRHLSGEFYSSKESKKSALVNEIKKLIK